MFYNISDIILSAEESTQLVQSIYRPDKEKIQRRDTFLNEGGRIKAISDEHGKISVDIPGLDLSFLDEPNNDNEMSEQVELETINHYNKYNETTLDLTESKALQEIYNALNKVYEAHTNPSEYKIINKEEVEIMVNAA